MSEQLEERKDDREMVEALSFEPELERRARTYRHLPPNRFRKTSVGKALLSYIEHRYGLTDHQTLRAYSLARYRHLDGDQNG